MTTALFRCAAACCLLAIAPAFAAAAEPPGPAYPRVNLACCYEVDAAWPQRADHVHWGAMSGIAIDEKENVWLYTRAQPPVQIYDKTGKYLGGWGNDVIDKAHFIKFGPDGKVWVSDVGNHVVMQFTREGKLLKTLGVRGEAGSDDRHLNKPTDMVVTPAGDVFVADGYGNNRIVHFDKDGRFVKAWGKLGTRRGEFSLPHAIAADSQGRLYVADRNNVRVQVFDQAGRCLDEWRNLLVPWGLAITKEDAVWACGSSPAGWLDGKDMIGVPPRDQLVMRLTTAGKVQQLWTFPKGEDGKEKPGELNWIHSIALDPAGNLYCGDIQGKRAQKFLKLKAEAER